jgi:hypothetical protein
LKFCRLWRIIRGTPGAHDATGAHEIVKRE